MNRVKHIFYNEQLSMNNKEESISISFSRKRYKALQEFRK